jgi:hypothetical protein
MQLSSIGFFAFHRNKRRKVCMGEKDITEKILADYNDVFADIVNVLLFGGKTIVDEVLKLMSVLTQDERFEQAQANGKK